MCNGSVGRELERPFIKSKMKLLILFDMAPIAAGRNLRQIFSFASASKSSNLFSL